MATRFPVATSRIVHAPFFSDDMDERAIGGEAGEGLTTFLEGNVQQRREGQAGCQIEDPRATFLHAHQDTSFGIINDISTIRREVAEVAGDGRAVTGLPDPESATSELNDNMGRVGIEIGAPYSPEVAQGWRWLGGERADG